MVTKDTILLPNQQVRVALRTLDAMPGALDRILDGTGITKAQIEQPSFGFPMAALWPLVGNIDRMLGAGWFLNFPMMWGIDIQSEFGMAMRSARNYGAALDVLAEFAHVRWPLGRVTARRTAQGVTLAFLPLMRFELAQWQMASAFAALNFNITTRTMIGDAAARVVYRFAGAAPPYAERHAAMLDGASSWGHDSMAVLVPGDVLKQAPVTADDALFSAMIAMLRDQANVRRGIASITPRVEQAIDAVTRGQPGVDDIAARIGLSRRTMERRLAAEGNSFRALLDGSLRRRFESAIDEPDMTADRMAERLGYHDGSSLQRACKRWFGRPFSAVRKSRAAG